MLKNNQQPVVICFGEILWDNLPSGRTAGGAPMNVAYHLNKCGAKSQQISRIGNDEAGKELLQFCDSIGLPSSFIQIDQQYPSGEVLGKVTANDEMVYDILPNAAWDYIEELPELAEVVAEADAFVYGSLAARDELSRNTLIKLLERAKFKVFDVNLRAPHYTRETIEVLLQHADVLKLNELELPLLTEWFYQKDATEPAAARYLLEQFQLQEIVITKGAEGAAYYSKDYFVEGKAYPVTVADTVGAGDSFLAAFLYRKLIGAEIPEALDYALATGAFIAGKNGACPPYTQAELAQFMG